MKNVSPRNVRRLLAAVSLALVFAFAFVSPSSAGLLARAAAEAETAAAGGLSREGYTLEQVVVLSRHNIRSPFGDGGLTEHEWFDWTAKPTELSVRGCTLETMMGRYFRLWLEKEGLFPEGWSPSENEVRVYANSLQRTIATARYFTLSLFPAADVKVETHMKPYRDDPVFTANLTFANRSYVAAARAQAMELVEDDIRDLEDNYALLADVLDMEQTRAWKNGRRSPLRTDDTKLILRRNHAPYIKGTLNRVLLASDSLILQYYEEPDLVKAAFGHELTFEQWVRIGEIKDVYGAVLYSAPLIAVNAAHPMLCEIRGELAAEGRRFSFLCGHDHNLYTVLAALGAEEYELPNAIERKTPIGGKLVFCRWSDPQGDRWITVDLVYQTTEQLRNLTLLDLGEPPAVMPMRFSVLEANADGLYAEQDFMALLDGSISAYDDLKKTYAS